MRARVKRQPKVREFRWLPNHKPVPRGWKLARNAPPTHHHRHARLIERKT